MIAALPRGYQTMLSRSYSDDDAASEGIRLSGGQAQRGDHDELISLGGAYARMFEYQAAGYASSNVS